MSFPKWLAEVMKIAGSDFHAMAVHYSFEAAFENGFSPKAAVRDCRKWLEA